MAGDATADFTAIVLAGSRPGRDAFAERFGTDLKALIPIAGEPMVRRPVRALLQTRVAGSVVVLSQAPDRIAAILPDDQRISARRSSGTIASTMLGLIADPATEWPILVTTADHALLDPAMVEEFWADALGADLAIGVVEKSALTRRLPGAKRTWLRFRGGAYTGANLFLLAGPQVTPVIEQWRSVEQDRKKGWRLIALLGPLVLIGTATRLLTIDGVLARLGRKLRLKIRAVRLSDPLAGVDVDKPDDHALVEEILAGRS